jgi:hypothetical protein
MKLMNVSDTMLNVVTDKGTVSVGVNNLFYCKMSLAELIENNPGLEIDRHLIVVNEDNASVEIPIVHDPIEPEIKDTTKRIVIVPEVVKPIVESKGPVVEQAIADEARELKTIADWTAFLMLQNKASLKEFMLVKGIPVPAKANQSELVDTVLDWIKLNHLIERDENE